MREHFDLRPAAILRDLDLRRPIYAKTAAYGHFGRDDHDFTWERTDKAEALRAAAGLDTAATPGVGRLSALPGTVQSGNDRSTDRSRRASRARHPHETRTPPRRPVTSAALGSGRSASCADVSPLTACPRL